jgi:hypothetical protein
MFANNDTLTWNGAVSHSTSSEKLTDLFYQATRGISRERLVGLLDGAWSTNRLLTLRMIAYLRQIKGGKGERDIGKWSLDWLVIKSPADLIYNLRHYVSTFGRWDDLVDLISHESVRKTVFDLVAQQLRADEATLDQSNGSISLVAKWVPSEGKRVDQGNGFNRLLAKHMGIPRKQLRQLLTRLRKAIGILETHLAEGTLEKVEYSHVPSVAMNRQGKRARHLSVATLSVSLSTRLVWLRARPRSIPHPLSSPDS